MDNKKKLKKELNSLWKKRVFEEWGTNCLLCSKRASSPHHYIPRSKSFGLTWDVANGVPLCMKHHYLIHFSHNPDVTTTICNRIKSLRGQEWHNYLMEHKNDGKDTVWWLEEQKEKLQKELEG